MPVRCSAQLRWTDYLLQWWTLLLRCLAIKLQDRWNTAILMAQAPIIACLVVLVFRKMLTTVAVTRKWPVILAAAGRVSLPHIPVGDLVRLFELGA